MACIDCLHALMLCQQATTHLRTQIIRQKTAFKEQNPVHAILEDMLYSRFWLLRAVFESLDNSGLSLSYLEPKFTMRLLRVTKSNENSTTCVSH